jgi:hypothetical protein
LRGAYRSLPYEVRIFPSDLREAAMFAEGRDSFRMLGLNPKPSWAEVWHLWTVLVPRRSISGQLLLGQVWRRHDGRRWIYKKFTEYDG